MNTDRAMTKVGRMSPVTVLGVGVGRSSLKMML